MTKKFVVVILTIALTACGSAVPAPTASSPGTRVKVEGGGAYTDVAPAELSEMLGHKDFVFVNTHIPYEGEIASTDAFIPFAENGPQQVGDYPPDKNAKIVLYCRSGRMSAIVAQELVQAGYTNVWNLEGGMRAWEEAGYEVIQK